MKNLTGQKLYLDTNLFISALEEIAPWVEITKYVLNAIDSGGCSAITSELTVAECFAHIGYQMKIAHLSNASDGFLRSICVASSLFRYEPNL